MNFRYSLLVIVAAHFLLVLCRIQNILMYIEIYGNKLRSLTTRYPTTKRELISIVDPRNR